MVSSVPLKALTDVQIDTLQRDCNIVNMEDINIDPQDEQSGNITMFIES